MVGSEAAYPLASCAAVSVAVRVSKRAAEDIAQAFQWYENERPDLGYRFMARVDETLERIAENPALFAPKIKDVRRALVDQFPYAIWYRLVDDVVVIACIHTHRSPRVATARTKLEP
jgi:plasmid stabilization system protein ParE